MPAHPRHARRSERRASAAVPAARPAAEVTAERLAHRVQQISFGLLLLAAGVGPLAPTIEATPSLRLIVQTLFVMSAAMWLLGAALEGRLTWARTGMGKFLLVLAAALVSATVNAAYRFPAILTLFSWFAGIAGFLVVLHVARDRRRRLLLLLAIGASAFVIAFHGLHQYVVDMPRALDAVQADHAALLRSLNLPAEAASDLEGRIGSLRIFGTFVLANSLAGFLILVLPALVGLLMDWWWSRPFGARGWPVLLTGALLLPIALTLFLTKSKGGWMAFLVAAAVFGAWGFWQSILRRRMQFACGILALLVVWSIAQWSGLLPPLRDYAGSFAVRYHYWRAGTKIVENHPLVGIGLDNFADFYAQYKRPEDQEARRAHNDYLQLAGEAGLIGLLAYAALWGQFWRRVRQGRALPLAEAGSGGWERYAAPAVVILGAGVFATESMLGGTLRTLRGFWGWEWLVALCAGWIGFVLVFERTARRPVSEEHPVLARTSFAVVGIGAGLVGYLVHSVADFNHYVGGTMQTAWVLMGLLLACRLYEEENSQRTMPLRPGVRLAILAGVTVLVLALLHGFVLRAIDSHGYRERAVDVTIQRSMEDRMSDLEAAIRANPLDAHTHALLSDQYADLWLRGRASLGSGISTLSQAIISAREAVRLNPARSEYHTRLGRLHELRFRTGGRIEEYQAALSAYQKAEELFPGNPDTALNLARLYDEAGLADFAQGKYRTARALSEEHEQYQEERRFTRDQLQQIDKRIRELNIKGPDKRPPPPAFDDARLMGWPQYRRELPAPTNGQ